MQNDDFEQVFGGKKDWDFRPTIEPDCRKGIASISRVAALSASLRVLIIGVSFRHRKKQRRSRAEQGHRTTRGLLQLFADNHVFKRRKS
jgi:hypothetical protein